MHPPNTLRQVRQRAGVTIEALAVRADVSPTLIGMTERVNYWPGEATRQKIADALGVDPQTIWPANNGSQAVAA